MGWHIHISGQVQGVGFRPFVYNQALLYNLHGWVMNSSDGVHIQLDGEEKVVRKFYQSVLNNAPKLSKISAHSFVEVATEEFSQFRILHSHRDDTSNMIITPDLGICEACRADIHKAKNRRYTYPFTTCTQCGPRYSILNGLPYDRVRTEMENFKQCQSCLLEFNDATDRRYYSQTNSCSECGITLSLHSSVHIDLPKTTNAIIEYIVDAWKNGEIVAIKSIGAYILTCDANNVDAIESLRKKKKRGRKPFALMYPSLTLLQQDLHINNLMSVELSGHITPIVIAEKNHKTDYKNIAPDMNQLGAMLPYTPLFELLLRLFNKPIVATSGNISNEAIIYKDDQAIQQLSDMAELIVSNDREIAIPQDDSVIRYSPFNSERIVIRRSRGLAPSYFVKEGVSLKTNILALGAMLKSTFSYLHEGNCFVSQYFGDLQSFTVELNYQNVLEKTLALYGSKPDVILCDKHLDYPSYRFGQSLAAQFGVQMKLVQHHRAHFAAVLAENNLLSSQKPTLGVIWDGAGLGDDNQIWGGEFFIYQNEKMARVLQFEYFDSILGDKMAREPRVSALSACHNIDLGAEQLRAKFDDTEWSIYSKLLEENSHVKTSSVGRLFDAVASLLNILDIQSFEAEAAIRLENLAIQYFKKHGLAFKASYFQEHLSATSIAIKPILRNIIVDIKKRIPSELIAAKFHNTLVDIIAYCADTLGVEQIAFSGGVFQNALLIDLIINQLNSRYMLYFHQELSSNDENISFGQIMLQTIDEKS